MMHLHISLNNCAIWSHFIDAADLRRSGLYL
jgi:hypothetical protein